MSIAMIMMRVLLVAAAAMALAEDLTRERRINAIVAAFVADAAAMPLHWIYDTVELNAILERENRTETPEFLDKSYAPFYSYPIGEGTPFAEQMLVYLRSLADEGAFDPRAVADSYAEYYSAAASAKRPFTSYMDLASTQFLAHFNAGRRWPHTGGDDAETNAVAHVLPVAAMRAGRPNFLRDCEDAIRVVQNNDDAVAFGLTFARMLEAVILGASVPEAIATVTSVLGNGTGNRNDAFFSHGLSKMARWRRRPPFDVTLELGQACDFPFHVFTAPHLLLHGNATWVEAVRETIRIGGENANRGSFIASLLAAAAPPGETHIPPEWLAKTTRFEEVRRLAEKIADGGGFGERGGIDHAASPAAAPRLGNAPGCVGHGNSTTSNATRPPSHPDDVRALTALYEATGGGGWTRNACWLNTSVPVCWWDQVACDGNDRVQQLRLASNNLDGALTDASFEGLDGLEIFQVTFSPKLAGPVPAAVASLPRLKHFYAWNSSLTSLPAKLPPSLTQIDLADNRLTDLPDGLADLAHVDTFDVDGNLDGVCPLSSKLQAWTEAVEYAFAC